MASFDAAYKIVHGHEGGYANTTGDKGGETYMGIARRWHSEWAGWALLDTWKSVHGQPRWNAILDLPPLTAAVVSFYRASWNELLGSQIASQPVANLLYDFATNTGAAVRVAQQVLVGMGFHLTADNRVGVQTLAAINAADPVKFHNQLLDARVAYLKKLVENDPTQAVFLPTWMARCQTFVKLQKKTPVPS